MMKYSRFVGAVSVERLVPSIHRRNSGCREQNDCRIAAIRRAPGTDTLHCSSHRYGVSSNVV